RSGGAVPGHRAVKEAVAVVSNPNDPFTDAQREGLYRAIFERRDVRSQFLPDAIPEAVLARILRAAHHAPSVGFMQPWDFIVIDSLAVREQVLDSFNEENSKASEIGRAHV